MTDEKISKFVVDNLRLKELSQIVEQNKPFYDAFLLFIGEFGYEEVSSFIHETDTAKAKAVIESYLATPSQATLFDGVGRPYIRSEEHSLNSSHLRLSRMPSSA